MIEPLMTKLLIAKPSKAMVPMIDTSMAKLQTTKLPFFVPLMAKLLIT